MLYITRTIPKNMLRHMNHVMQRNSRKSCSTFSLDGAFQALPTGFT